MRNIKIVKHSNKKNKLFYNIWSILISKKIYYYYRPPFTLQRICEVILEPEKYYKSSRKLLYAF